MLTKTQKLYIKALIKTQSIQVRSINEKPFILRSGKESYIFINHARLASSPHGYKAFIDAICILVQNIFKSKEFIFCNADSKISAQMVGSLAYILNKPQIIFKSKELTVIEKGSGEQLTGDPKWNLPIIIADDVISSRDGTAANVGKLVQKTFPRVKDIQIFVGVARSRNLIQGKLNFASHAVLSFDEIIADVWNSLSSSQQKAVEKEGFSPKNN